MSATCCIFISFCFPATWFSKRLKMNNKTRIALTAGTVATENLVIMQSCSTELGHSIFLKTPFLLGFKIATYRLINHKIYILSIQLFHHPMSFLPVQKRQLRELTFNNVYGKLHCQEYL